MPSPTQRLIDACRDWAEAMGEPPYTLAYDATLFLGGDSDWVGTNPELASMRPQDRERRPMAEHLGHPTLEQVQERIDTLVAAGVFEPFLAAAVARGIEAMLERLTDTRAILDAQRDTIARVERLEGDPSLRRAFVEDVRARQAERGIPPDDQESDRDVDAFVAKARERLAPPTPSQMAVRERQLLQWRRSASDLLDFGEVLGEGLKFES